MTTPLINDVSERTSPRHGSPLTHPSCLALYLAYRSFHQGVQASLHHLRNTLSLPRHPGTPASPILLTHPTCHQTNYPSNIRTTPPHSHFIIG
ncbi:hypothetical protein EYR40_007865 [Pleurotus pulmonarius]|nr:hypothetical protein EYR40_007865 [Pleurotus pulmonarius]